MQISLLKRLGQALTISQLLEYTCLPRICYLQAEEMIHDKTTPLTRDRSEKKKLATTAPHENMPTAPSIPYRHSCFRYHNPTSNDAPLPLEPSPILLLPAAAPLWAHATQVRPALSMLKIM
ncbi:unnamed protein product [Ectocarpus sp. 12 AP-2014]